MNVQDLTEALKSNVGDSAEVAAVVVAFTLSSVYSSVES